jgi:hypothetical protein
MCDARSNFNDAGVVSRPYARGNAALDQNEKTTRSPNSAELALIEIVSPQHGGAKMISQKCMSILAVITLAATVCVLASKHAFTSTTPGVVGNSRDARACERMKSKMQDPAFNTWKTDSRLGRACGKTTKNQVTETGVYPCPTIAL